MISVHLRWLLFTEKWFQYTNLCQSNNDHADSDKKWPDHHSFIKIFSPFSALKSIRKKVRTAYLNVLLVSTHDLYGAFIPEFLWDGDVFDNRWYYSDFHGLLGLTFPTRKKHIVLNKSLESKVYCGSYGNLASHFFWQKFRETNVFRNY